GLCQILTGVMEEVRRSIRLDVRGGDVLHSLLSASWLQALLRVYERLQAFLRDAPAPVLTNATGVLLQLTDVRASESCSEDAEELCRLLGQPHLQALLSAHDAVAQRDYGPVLPPMPEELPEDEEATRTVCLVKNNQPLGATIKRHELSGEIFIARVIHGGLADRSGLLHAGDRIIEVNGFSVGGMEPEQVIQVVQARALGSIMFKVVPITERPVHRHMTLYVRAMVNYSPQQDPTIPCADAGVGFGKGDILEIVDQSDALWWQARKLPGHAGCAGLGPVLQRSSGSCGWSQPYLPHTCIRPTLSLSPEDDLVAMEDRCVEADEEAFESDELREGEKPSDQPHLRLIRAGFRRSLRLCRRRFYSTSQLAGHAPCPSSCRAPSVPYEEVVRYQRQPQDPHRLVALLGPSGVGVNELRKRLIRSDPGLFQGAVPHTTRPPKGYEEPGRDYHFTSREMFDAMVSQSRFLEYGEYKGNLYGTSVQAVRDVLSSGKICVLDIEPNAIQAVRTPELKAFIVYVKPPPLERLRESRRGAAVATGYYVNRPFRDEDFQEMEAAAQKMESQYWQFFNHVLVNDQLQDARVQLLAAVNQAQDEPQWVPSSWIRPDGQ
uniref:Membrane protein, palmitoylated 4-like n=1 Tax=Tetraodon nigroviridis TaxID=99883 RepID=H3C3Q1_TETNG